MLPPIVVLVNIRTLKSTVIIIQDTAGGTDRPSCHISRFLITRSTYLLARQTLGEGGWRWVAAGIMYYLFWRSCPPSFIFEGDRGRQGFPFELSRFRAGVFIDTATPRTGWGSFERPSLTPFCLSVRELKRGPRVGVILLLVLCPCLCVFLCPWRV